MHNYADSKDGSEGSATHLTRTVLQVRSFAGGYWQGWPPGTAAAAQVCVTEGGWVRPDGTGSSAAADQEQATRMQGTMVAAAAVPGVAMLTQYLIRTDSNYDCGMRTLGGAARPVLQRWSDLHTGTGTVPRVLA